MNKKAISLVRNRVILDLLPWFETTQRKMPWRSNRTPYRVWVSELMLQQTRVEQVIPYFERFIKRFPVLEALASASQEEVLKQWEGLGYYSRARNLHKAAQFIVEKKAGCFPRTYEGLLTLPGVGPYTAAAIGSLAFNLDLAVVDGNVIRVLARLFAYDEVVQRNIAKRKFQWLSDCLLPAGLAGDYNEAMMELGATICLPKNPNCMDCPMSTVCLGFKRGNPTVFPVKQPRKKVPHLVVGAGVVVDKSGKFLIARRLEKAMLGGLWEFPGGKQKKGETIQACIIRELKEELGIEVEVGDFLVIVHHAYSHFTMELHAYFAKIISGKPHSIECQDFRWVELSKLRDFPYSRADLYIIDELEKREKR